MESPSQKAKTMSQITQFNDHYFQRNPYRLYKLIEFLRTHPQIQLTSVKDATILRCVAWGEERYRSPMFEMSLISYVALHGGADAIRQKQFYEMSILVAVELLMRYYEDHTETSYTRGCASLERARRLLVLVLSADLIHDYNIQKMRSLLCRSPASHDFINLMADHIDHNDKVHAKAYTEAIRRYFTKQVGQNQENAAVAIQDAVDASHRTQANAKEAEKTSCDANHSAIDTTGTAVVVKD